MVRFGMWVGMSVKVGLSWAKKYNNAKPASRQNAKTHHAFFILAFVQNIFKCSSVGYLKALTLHRPHMTVPKHIAVIMDGNRRFSKRLMMKPWKGHEWGAEKLKQLVNWSRELGVAELTVYAFSVQNFERSAEEFNTLMKIFEESAKQLRDEIDSGQYKDENISVTFIGRLSQSQVEGQDRLSRPPHAGRGRLELVLLLAGKGRGISQATGRAGSLPRARPAGSFGELG